MDRSEAASILFQSWSDYAKAAGHKPGTTSIFNIRAGTELIIH
jgi:putative DNA primase/helicase